jgi:hypothetical protein
MTVALRAVTGAHLTATDKRNILAILGQPGFEFFTDRAYRVNGRKAYSLTKPTSDRVEVVIAETETDGFGRRVERTYRSQFTVAER